MQTEGVVVTIPMPGHPVNTIATPQLQSTAAQMPEEAGADATDAAADPGAARSSAALPASFQDTEVEGEAVRRLDDLVRSHDVCFALTDSREARCVGVW